MLSTGYAVFNLILVCISLSLAMSVVSHRRICRASPRRIRTDSESEIEREVVERKRMYRGYRGNEIDLVSQASALGTVRFKLLSWPLALSSDIVCLCAIRSRARPLREHTARRMVATRIAQMPYLNLQ